MKCIICNSEFELPKSGGHNKKTCSPSCKKINDNDKKRESRERLKESKATILKNLSNEWRIPIYLINQYGIDFLKSNPCVIEVLQIQTKISGKFTFLSEEEKLIRRRANESQARHKFRENIVYKVYTCKVCGGSFDKSGSQRKNNRVTCSDACSKELSRIQSNEASKRQREKRKSLACASKKD